MSFNDDLVKAHDLSTLKIIGTVGEPIGVKAFNWLQEVVGENRVAIMDTYWQTETGGHVIAPGVPIPRKAGAATLPFFGIQPVLLDNDGNVIEGPGEGNLVGYFHHYQVFNADCLVFLCCVARH